MDPEFSREKHLKEELRKRGNLLLAKGDVTDVWSLTRIVFQ
jgi:hypothetical protein